MISVLTHILVGYVSAFVAVGTTAWYYRSKEAKTELERKDEVEANILEALEVHRRRQLADARRENMPRSDAGQPAVVRPAFSRIPPRKP